MQMAVLLCNHHMLAEEPDDQMEIMEEAVRPAPGDISECGPGLLHAGKYYDMEKLEQTLSYSVQQNLVSMKSVFTSLSYNYEIDDGMSKEKFDILAEKYIREYPEILFIQHKDKDTVTANDPFILKGTEDLLGLEFIHIAEYTGLIVPLGNLVLRNDTFYEDVCRIINETIQAKAAIFTGNLFMGIGEDEMSKARTVLYKMMFNLANMEMGEQEDD